MTTTRGERAAEERPLLQTPKRTAGKQSGTYNYYAAFSESFVEGVLDHWGASAGAALLDPWNGSGTTTTVGTRHGLSAIGFDINPVMVVVALAAFGNPEQARYLFDRARKPRPLNKVHAGACLLQRWFDEASSRYATSLADRLFEPVIGNADSAISAIQAGHSPTPSSSLALQAVFSAVKDLSRSFETTNPTWIRMRLHQQVLHVNSNHLRAVVRRYLTSADEGPIDCRPPDIQQADSRALPLRDQTVDYVLASPPYCTRIDYPTATARELGVLGCTDQMFHDLRQLSIGTTLSPVIPTTLQEFPSLTALRLLERIKEHPSKASASYYSRTYLSYFSRLTESINEIIRVMRYNGRGALVVQNSYYKDLNVDLITIVVELIEGNGAVIERVEQFPVTRTRRTMNPRATKYGGGQTFEAAVFFRRPIRSTTELVNRQLNLIYPGLKH